MIKKYAIKLDFWYILKVGVLILGTYIQCYPRTLFS